MPRSREPEQCRCYAYSNSCNHVGDGVTGYVQCPALAGRGDKYCVPCILDREKRGYGANVPILARVRKTDGSHAMVRAIRADRGLVLLKLEASTTRRLPGYKYGILHEGTGLLIAVGTDLKQTRRGMRTLIHAARLNGERIDWTGVPSDAHCDPCRDILSRYHSKSVRLAADIADEQRHPRDTGEDAIPKV